MYRIKRFSLIDDEKLFSRKDDIDVSFSSSTTIVKEIIKCLEMYDSGARWTPHWIEVACGTLIKCRDSSIDPYSVIFAGACRYNRYDQKQVDKDVRDKYSKTGLDYISNMKDYILNESKNGEVKYSSLLPNKNNFIYTDVEYSRILILLSNVLNGNIDVGIINYELILKDDSDNTVIKELTSDRIRTNKGSLRPLQSTISKFIFNLKGYSNEYIEQKF